MSLRALGRVLFVAVLLFGGWMLVRASDAAVAQDRYADVADWTVPEGFVVEVASDGYVLPTSIAVVPEPGPNPSDPAYFVTELRGRITAVSNDGTKHAFAEVSTFEPNREDYPSSGGEGGLAGICLDPANGYVFVTFSYKDEGGLLRNDMARFESTQGSFSTQAGDALTFTDLFADYQSGLSHQIGGCEVIDDSVLVGIGDGWNPTASQEIDQLLGKVIKMTLDGAPHPDNPFAADESEAARYVYAYGLRNPFGILSVDEDVLISNNGPSVDSFLRIESGENYQWDGTDWSIGTRADALFSPVVSPVQMDYLPLEGAGFPDEFSDKVFIAAATRLPGVIALTWDAESDSVLGVPEHFVSYQGESRQEVVGLAVAADGLYFVPILPDESGRSVVLKVSYDPSADYPHVSGRGSRAEVLLDQYNCLACHQLNGQGGTVGPNLDFRGLEFRLANRLSSADYREQISAVNAIAEEPFASYTQERAEVLDGAGIERSKLWLTYHLLEPKFDNPDAQMPNLGLTEGEAELLASFLIGDQEQPSFTQRIRNYFRAMEGDRAAILGFAGGAAGLLAIAALATGGVWLVRRRRNGTDEPAPDPQPPAGESDVS